MLLNIREAKGDEKEQTISSFKERFGINASLLQKVSLLIRKEGLILKDKSLNNKFKISQRQLRSLLTGVLGRVLTWGRFNLSFWLLLISKGQVSLLTETVPEQSRASWTVVQSACFASSTVVPFQEEALARGRNSFEVLSSSTACLKTQHLWCHFAGWLLLVW